MRVRALLAAAAVMMAAAPPLALAQAPLLPSGPESPGAPPSAEPVPVEPPQTIQAPQPLAPAADAPPPEAAAPAPDAPMPDAPMPGAPMPGAPSPPAAAPPGTVPPAAAPPEGRVFCNQRVSFTLAPRDSVPAAYRDFVGIFSDAAWTPRLCAALIVENVSPDGLATIVYVFGSMGTSAAGGGVLNGTGIVRHGELKFQNSDGTQFSFSPFYSDLDGHLMIPRGQTYETIFKRAF